MSKAAPVIEWLLKEGRFTAHNMRATGDRLAEQVNAAGIPVARAFFGVRTLHPQIAATAYIWHRGHGTERITASWDDASSPEFLNAPTTRVWQTGETVRLRLDVPDEHLDFEVLRDLKRQGMTDYIALPMLFSDGRINPTSFQTDAPDGFADEDVAALRDVIDMLAPIVETETAHRIARQVIQTYVGRRTGELVLSGAITRGSGETIDALIWYCDLRNFTGLTDSLSSELLLTLLNDFFEIMAGVVMEAGGEVLKFIGDAMLAIWALDDQPDHSAAAQCAKALAAAQRASALLEARNGDRRSADVPPIRYGLALHLGAVHYGNIGAPDRLDFTVIGPAVNHAARLDEVGAHLGQPIVASASVAAALPGRLSSLGVHDLRGVAAAQEVFAPPPLSDPSTLRD